MAGLPKRRRTKEHKRKKKTPKEVAVNNKDRGDLNCRKLPTPRQGPTGLQPPEPPNNVLGH
jgi:hypothetical protein